VPARDNRSDAELVEAAAGGDLDAFEALYRRHRDWVVRLARRFTGSEHDALDVLQDTFAYLLRKLPGLRLTARMTTFLYPVVKHLSVDAVRRRGRHTPGEALPDVPASDEPAAGREELAAVLSALPEAQREVVLMRYVDGMPLAEIAEALDVPLGTVKSRLHNALQTLRDDPRTRRYFLEP
jgi:RNA polymerase sigma-70 factor (ECF subfamily)